MPVVNVIDWWSSVKEALDGQGRNGVATSTPDGWARRRSVASAESRLRVVLFRSLHALHQMEAKIGNFSTFGLFVDSTVGTVEVTQVDEISPLGSPLHSPEVYSMFLKRGSFGPVSRPFAAKSRSWAFGILASTLLGAPPPWNLSQRRGEERETLKSILKVAIEHKEGSLSDVLFTEVLKTTVSPGLTDLIRECLWIDPIRRASVRELLHHPYFRKMKSSHVSGRSWQKVPVVLTVDSGAAQAAASTDRSTEQLCVPLYYSFKELDGGDTSLSKKPRVSLKPTSASPTVLMLPSYLDGAEGGDKSVPAENLSLQNGPNSVERALDTLRQVHVDKNALKKYQGVYVELRDLLQRSDEATSVGDLDEWKEKVVPRLSWHMIKFGIPNHFRPAAWVSALGINEKHSVWTYPRKIRRANRMLSTKTSASKRVKNLERQLKKDLPRCHRYHHVMRLPRVQFLMKRMLCAWVFDSPGRVYWQGLDSLCAVFAVTFVEKEPTAYACMDEFLSRLLPNIFVDDNSEALQERLLRLQQWTGLLDPELAQHFASVGVTPNLYAIPWLMTLFAHIFPLDLLFKVWDVLLGLHQHQHCSAVEGGAEMLPTLFAVCFLSEMRERLLKCNFEQAVAFLTRLPTPLEQIVELALERLPTAFLLVPRSVLRGTTNTSLEAAPAAADDPGKVPSSSSTSKKQPLQTIRFERSARVSPNEILRDPMIEHTLVVDVRSASRFREVHILGSRNFSAAGLQASGIAKACKQIQKVRMALKRKYIAVVGEVVMDAAEMAAALVDDGIAFVLIIDGEFNDVAGNCVASEMIVQGSK